MSGCDPLRRYKAFSFIFDGVPDPTLRIVVDSLPKKDSLAANLLAGKTKNPEYFYHKPYQENKCNNCHITSEGNKLLKPPPELCYGCHEDFNNVFNTLHGPVASGYCLACHNPHFTKNKKLLLRTNRELCFYCHRPKHVLQSKMHTKIGDKDCTECHSPHGGNNRGTLKPGTCYSCHEDFSNQFKVLHGPVANRYCNGCHSTHMATTGKLLLRENQQLCLYCHKPTHIQRNPAHQKIEKSNCTECHNPHGGDDRNIIIPALPASADSSKIKAVKDSSSEEKDKITK